RQEVGPQSLVIEALVRFRDGRSSPRRVERASGEEIRAGLSGISERETASNQTPQPAVRSWCDRLRTEGMPVRLPPPCLVVAQPSTEVRHLRSPRHAVVRFPAVHGLGLLARQSLTHVEIVRLGVHDGETLVHLTFTCDAVTVSASLTCRPASAE